MTVLITLFLQKESLGTGNFINLQPLVRAIQQEHFQSFHCDILSTSKMLVDQVQIIGADGKDSSIQFQTFLGYMSPCLISIVDAEKTSNDQIDEVLKTTFKVRRFSMLLLNCDAECIRRSPVHPEKATFYASKPDQMGNVYLRLLCPKRRNPKKFLIWNAKFDSMKLFSTKCPFIFTGHTVNVSYTVAPASTIA